MASATLVRPNPRDDSVWDWLRHNADMACKRGNAFISGNYNFSFQNETEWTVKMHLQEDVDPQKGQEARGYFLTLPAHSCGVEVPMTTRLIIVTAGFFRPEYGHFEVFWESRRFNWQAGLSICARPKHSVDANRFKVDVIPGADEAPLLDNASNAEVQRSSSSGTQQSARTAKKWNPTAWLAKLVPKRRSPAGPQQPEDLPSISESESTGQMPGSFFINTDGSLTGHSEGHVEQWEEDQLQEPEGYLVPEDAWEREEARRDQDEARQAPPTLDAPPRLAGQQTLGVDISPGAVPPSDPALQHGLPSGFYNLPVREQQQQQQQPQSFQSSQRSQRSQRPLQPLPLAIHQAGVGWQAAEVQAVNADGSLTVEAHEEGAAPQERNVDLNSQATLIPAFGPLLGNLRVAAILSGEGADVASHLGASLAGTAGAGSALADSNLGATAAGSNPSPFGDTLIGPDPNYQPVQSQAAAMDVDGFPHDGHAVRTMLQEELDPSRHPWGHPARA